MTTNENANINLEPTAYRKIPTGLRWFCWWRFMWLYLTSQSYDRGYFNSFTAAMIPALRYLYKGQEDEEGKIREVLMRTRNYYLCEQSFSCIIFGIILGMEEQKANGADISSELIDGTRSSLMGPLSGMGDSIHGSTTRQIAIALTLPYCIEGSVIGALLMFLGINITPPLVAVVGYAKGYQTGSSFVLKILQSGWMQKIAAAAGIMAMFIMGGMTSKYVNISTILQFTSDINTISLQDMLNNAIPGLLPLAAVFGYYGLIRKKVHTNWLIIGTMVLGILLSYLGIM